MMRSVLVVLAAVAATVISAGPVAAKEVGKPPAAALAAKLRLATPLDGAGASKVYIVRMAAKPAASYKGGISGFAKSASDKGQRYNSQSGEAQAYTRLLQLAAGRAAGLDRRQRPQDLQLRAFDERLCRAPHAHPGGEAAQEQVGLERVGRPDHAARHQQLTALPRSPQPDGRFARGARPDGRGRDHRHDRHGRRPGAPELRGHQLRRPAGPLVRRLPVWRGLVVR